MLTTSSPEQLWASPKGTEEARRAAWSDWYGTIEWMRVLFEMPIGAAFETCFEGLLTPRELLALPKMKGRWRWLGGDATLDRLGALEWCTRKYLAITAKELLVPLREAPGVSWEGEEEIIAVIELLAVIVLTTTKPPTGLPGAMRRRSLRE